MHSLWVMPRTGTDAGSDLTARLRYKNQFVPTCSRVLQTSTGWVTVHARVAELAEHIASAQAGSSLVCSVPLAHCLAFS